MIDEDITYAEKGYYSTELSVGSNKPVYAVCEGDNCNREGGRGRWVRFRDYRDLCHLCAHRTEEYREMRSDMSKGDKAWFYEKAHSDKTKEKMRLSALGEKNHMYDKKHTDEARKKMSDANSGEKNHMYGKKHSDKTIAKICKAREVQVGDKNPNWQGGISFGEYCPKFNKQIKQNIRNMYDNCDYISGLSYTICNNGNNLSVHHVDYNKQQGCDDHEWRLIPLSVMNHTRTNANRPFWNNIFTYSMQYDEEYYSEENKNFDVFEYINEYNNNIIIGVK